MKFKYFQAPVMFSSTFKALNLGEKIQVLSRMRGNPAPSYLVESPLLIRCTSEMPVLKDVQDK